MLMNTSIYDLIIIGGGPAGCAGAVYASRKKLRTLIATPTWGGQSIDSGDIQNWIGTPSISGTKLAESLEAHVKAYALDMLDIVSGEKVMSVKEIEGGFEITTDMEKSYRGKTILMTAGSKRRRLEIENADRFEHKGITYCASCDGPLFSGMDVAVVGGGNAAFETAAQLLAYCKSVTLINRSDVFRADEITVENVLKHENMRAIKNAELIGVDGEQFVTGLRYKTLGEEKTLPVSGIFVEIGQLPNTDMMTGLVDIDAGGKIVTDPMTGRTSKLGVWAAGDCTNGLYHQNNIAAGDAVKALENIYYYLRAGSR